jgi:hypothetical protein
MSGRLHPTIARHLNLATHQPADTDWQRAYINGMLNMTNDDLHSVAIPNVAEDVDPDDLF